MKQLFTILLIGFAGAASAQIHTVNNAEFGGAQFKTIQEAVDAAAHGDTIFIHGSPIEYAAFKQENKRLTFIGPGWAPAKNNPVRAVINGVPTVFNTASAQADATCNGSVYQGLVVMSNFEFAGTSAAALPVNNIRIERCEFRGRIGINIGGGNYIIEGNYFTGSVVGFGFTANKSYSNFLFQNNVFRIGNFNNGVTSGLNNASNFIFDHNLFYTNQPGTSGSTVFRNAASKFLTITNNVFVNMDVASDLSQSTFNNNITFYRSDVVVPEAPWLVNDNIDGGGNHHNVNPQLTAQDEVNEGADNPLLDFSIAAGPANDSGTDGKDLGLLFDETGSLNWLNARAARLPFIFSMNITNPTIGPGEELHVEVTAKKQN